ncbi:hypothetical protein EBR11_03745 [bacterium]|jgi:hypothetical protein|nr:hypothetical protein [Verrucomicrobiota bacterium]NBX01628.1 hypothetical protein [bacterium]
MNLNKMKLELDPTSFPTKDAFIRASIARARDLAVQAWDEEYSNRQEFIAREVSSLSKTELARRLIKLMSRPSRARAKINDSIRTKAKSMRNKGFNVREISAELGISIPSVYNITKD